MSGLSFNEFVVTFSTLGFSSLFADSEEITFEVPEHMWLNSCRLKDCACLNFFSQFWVLDTRANGHPKGEGKSAEGRQFPSWVN